MKEITNETFGISKYSNIVSIRAGIVTPDPKNPSILIPQPTKGELTIIQTRDMEVKRIGWLSNDHKDEQTTIYEALNASFTRVTHTPNVKLYLLKGEHTHMYYWLQYVTDKEEERLVKNFNKLLSYRPPKRKAVEESTEKEVVDEGKGVVTNEGGSVSTPNVDTTTAVHTPPTSVPTPQTDVNTPETSVNTNINTNNTFKSTAVRTPSGFSNYFGAFSPFFSPSFNPKLPPVQLSSMFNNKTCMFKLMYDDEASKELVSFLPPEYQNVEEIANVFKSPHFTSCLDSLTQAIYSNNLPVLASAIGIPASSLTDPQRVDPMQQIVDGLERLVSNSNNEATSTEKESTSSDFPQKKNKKEDDSSS